MTKQEMEMEIGRLEYELSRAKETIREVRKCLTITSKNDDAYPTAVGQARAYVEILLPDFLR